MNTRTQPHEVTIAQPKLRANALIEHWPADRREQILDWINQGHSLRRVADKIRKQYRLTIHHTTLGKYYARERRRRFERDCLETSTFYGTLADHQKKNPNDIRDSMHFLLRMEFMRHYTTRDLTPTQFLQFFRAFLRLQAETTKEKTPTTTFPNPWNPNFPLSTPGPK